MTSPTHCPVSQLLVCTSVARVFMVALCGLLPSLAAAQSLPSGWTAADVGTPSVQGAATFDNGRFRVRGAGADIGGLADEFMFVYQQLTGDGDIVARVDRILNASTGAKAGVMIRESLAADARQALAAVTAARGLAFQRRLTGGLTTQTSGGAARGPMWVKLERRGSTIRAFQSVDGAAWTLIGTDAISMQPTVFVGLAVTSRQVDAAAESIFTNVAVTPVTAVPSGPLPSGWTSVDIGNPQVAGSADYDAGTYTVRGAGRDIRGSNDEFHYVYRRVDGDTEIVARVTAVENVSSWARAGVMIRDALTPNAAHYSMFVTTERGIAFQRRPNPGGRSFGTITGGARAPFWVRLERRGDRITAFQSADGATWTQVGTGTLSLPSVYVGLAVTSRDAAETTTALFESLSVRAPGNQPPSVSLTEPANNASYTAPASVPIKATASDPDGTVARVDFYSGATLIGSDTSAPYEFTWNNVPAGNYSLTAVARDDDNVTTTSAPRTITVTAVNPPPTVALTAPPDGNTYTAPATITLAATASDAGGAVVGVDFYAGTTLIGTDASSPYSVTWTNVAVGTYSLTAVARDNGGASTTSAARTVIVTSSQSLPSGWSAGDIGQPPVAGSATHNNGTFTVSGAGETASTADQFHYVYRAFTGDVEIISRVATLQTVQQWTKAGVMIRETLTTNSAYGAMFVSASGGMAFHRRLTTGGSRQTTSGSAARAPRWVRLERRGSAVTASESADGVSWATVGTITFSQAVMFVGLAVASADPNQATTAQFDGVIVRTPSTSNQPPTVALTAPANGATFPANSSITLTATASDTDGTIAEVRFFAGTTLIATDTNSPYSVTWNNVPAGTYSLTAVARDDDNATTTSAARSITVGTAPPLLFRAVFVASSNHNTAVDRYELKVFTAGSNPDTATPVATRDLGKPAVTGGECTVDITTTVQALAPGSYIVTVTAIGPGGSARSAPTTFTR